MHGKVIQFKADIANFKVKDGAVTIQLAADTKSIILDELSKISEGNVIVKLESTQTEMFSIDDTIKESNHEN